MGQVQKWLGAESPSQATNTRWLGFGVASKTNIFTLFVSTLRAFVIFDMTLAQQEKPQLIDNMRCYGGNFVSKLADVLAAADHENTQRIYDAFPDVIEKYIALGML